MPTTASRRYRLLGGLDGPEQHERTAAAFSPDPDDRFAFSFWLT